MVHTGGGPPCPQPVVVPGFVERRAATFSSVPTPVDDVPETGRNHQSLTRALRHARERLRYTEERVRRVSRRARFFGRVAIQRLLARRIYARERRLPHAASVHVNRVVEDPQAGRIERHTVRLAARVGALFQLQNPAHPSGRPGKVIERTAVRRVDLRVADAAPFLVDEVPAFGMLRRDEKRRIAASECGGVACRVADVEVRPDPRRSVSAGEIRLCVGDRRIPVRISDYLERGRARQVAVRRDVDEPCRYTSGTER